jgi:hypothetical protein
MCSVRTMQRKQLGLLTLLRFLKEVHHSMHHTETYTTTDSEIASSAVVASAMIANIPIA